jgi:hypothetical protein
MTSVRAEKADTIAAALRPLIYLQHTSTIPHSRIDADKWEKQTLPHLSSCDRLNSGASAPPKDFADPFHVHRPRSPFVTGLFITPGPHTVPRASAADGWVRALVGATRAEINSPERSVYRPAIRKIKRREESREGGNFFTAEQSTRIHLRPVAVAAPPLLQRPLKPERSSWTRTKARRARKRSFALVRGEATPSPSIDPGDLQRRPRRYPPSRPNRRVCRFCGFW